MKTKFILTFLALFLLVMTSIAAVSAKTIVAGKIYDSPNFETANAVSDANINVTCKGNLLTTQSLSDGTYSVSYEDTDDCPDGSIVTVVAEKDGVTNSGTGDVHDYTAVIPDIYIGIVNIALIPEFGAAVGVLTVLSAIGVFFFVRRK
jgi:major membrane immunogen (membrane-anchored lipoprotein)